MGVTMKASIATTKSMAMASIPGPIIDSTVVSGARANSMVWDPTLCLNRIRSTAFGRKANELSGFLTTRPSRLALVLLTTDHSSVNLRMQSVLTERKVLWSLLISRIDLDLSVTVCSIERARS